MIIVFPQEKGKDGKTKLAEDSIYGEIGDYVPSVSKDKSRSKDKKKSNYFEKPDVEEPKSSWANVRPSKSSSVSLGRAQSELILKCLLLPRTSRV